MKYRLLCCVLLALGFNNSALYAQEPASDWRTAESAHFKINFRPAQRSQANHALSIAERVHVYVTKELKWTPKEKTELVLIGSVDFANGYATPLPFNQSGIYLTAPNSGELLSRDDWLEKVILHEYVHIVHLDRVRGFPKILRAAFGRTLFAFPNVFQPNWVAEGLATYYESEPELHIGRLQNSAFEAQMRDEFQRGFRSLREVNASGRGVPQNRAYLYGAYFFDFMKCRYGEESIYRYIDDYSNNILPFQMHTNPRGATGKTMEFLWEEFLEDLQQQMEQRSESIFKIPATLGNRVNQESYLDVYSMSIAKNGEHFAVIEDGITRPQLVRYNNDGSSERLNKVRYGASIDVRDDKMVLISQPEVCGSVALYFDLYSSKDGNLKRLTKCGRYLRAAWIRDDTGQHSIVAIRNALDTQDIVLLNAEGNDERVLISGTSDSQWIDLNSTADGKAIALIGLHKGEFGVYEYNLDTQQKKLLYSNIATKHSIKYSSDEQTLYFISDESGVPNVWRYKLDLGQAERVTHVHTAVTALAGEDAQGRISFSSLANGYYQLNSLNIAEVKIDTLPTSRSAQNNALPAQRTKLTANTEPELLDADKPLASERAYTVFETLSPRSWMPLVYAEADAIGIGAAINGSDVLNHHHYLLQPILEFSQSELLGLMAYQYQGRLYHDFAISRDMAVTRVIEIDDIEEVQEYKIDTKLQWTSFVPLIRWDNQLLAGIGAAVSQVDLNHINGNTIALEDEKLGAAFITYNSASAQLLSEENSEGIRLRVLHETYAPFESQYDGEVTRYDLHGYLPLGPSVIALQVIEARAKGRTEPYQLGGAYGEFSGLAPSLNSRELALRGYKRDQVELEGANVRVATLEWRVPLADIDRHIMVPPIGINRLSASVFFESGSHWAVDAPVADFGMFRSYGIEMRAEIIVGYFMYLPMRLGVAKGIDEFGGTEAYFTIELNY